MDYMLDPPDDDYLYHDADEHIDGVDDYGDDLYDEDEAAANASSNWQNSRNF